MILKILLDDCQGGFFFALDFVLCLKKFTFVTYFDKVSTCLRICADEIE